MNKEDSKLSRLTTELGWTADDVDQLIEEIVEKVKEKIQQRNDIEQDDSILEKRITLILTDLGTPFNVRGFRYLREAIKLVYKDEKLVHSMTKKLYPMVGKEFDVSPQSTEHAIRHLIEVTWNRRGIDVFKSFFGNTTNPNKKKPTCSEFIALVADYLRLERDLK